MSIPAHISEHLRSIAGRLMHHHEADVRSEGALILRLVEDQYQRDVEKALEVARHYTERIQHGRVNPLLNPPSAPGAHRLYR
jgi:hypothetical protein